VTRKRTPSAIDKDRAWGERHAAYLARGRANLPPQPDPAANPKEFHVWVRDNARSGRFTTEERQLFSDLKTLPRSKLKRRRDEDRWGTIYCLLLCQERWVRPPAVQALDIDDYDLATCKLGKYPGADGKGSRQLQLLLEILKGCDQPAITPSRLYDSIRGWRKRRREMSPASR
jgi:hypothetical protein